MNDSLVLAQLFTSISQLQGVGPKRAELYRNLDVHSVRDLLLLMPARVVQHKMNPALCDISTGDTIVKNIIVQSINIPRSRRAPAKVFCETNGEPLHLTYFNLHRKMITEMFTTGARLIVSGEAIVHSDFLEIIHPTQVVGANESFKIAEFEPIYPATRGLHSRFIHLTIKRALSKLLSVPEWLPEDLLATMGWQGFVKALQIIHTPKSAGDVQLAHKAKQRLAFDEILSHQVKLYMLREDNTKLHRPSLVFTGTLKQKLIESLPFTLTASQNQVISEIEADLHSTHPAARLVQGDVGSGKTIVALSVILDVVEAGFQTAIMAPTEILATQHMENISKLIAPLNVTCTLLLGSMSESKKRKCYEEISSGAAHIIIGTHALFQERADYHKLQLVVVDEQHRFGVLQRKQLLLKGDNVDLVMMTATPIPRTLQMVSYGDMDVSIMRDKPSERIGVLTSILSHKKICELQHSIVSKVGAGEKVYWVCPLIKETEALDLAHVQARHMELDALLPGMVGLIHGKMRSQERDEAMRKFMLGEYKVIVATTVIEVGVDVRDATIMVIENAERFGLSQLHQLRGRVGRGQKQSYCLLVYGQKLSMVGRQRLEVMKRSNDGFIIAEEDLKIRGAGDVVGTRQSGSVVFRVFNPDTEQALLEKAFAMANTGNIKNDLLLKIYADHSPASTVGAAVKV